jgi:hypothetical protein
MLWIGLESTEMVLSQSDKNSMAIMVSAIMQGCDCSLDVDLSMNRGEARMMRGRKKISSLLAFVRGDCNMKLNQVITCHDGVQVDQISYNMLPVEEKFHLHQMKIPFFLFDNLSDENERMIVAANWDGFGDAP